MAYTTKNYNKGTGLSFLPYSFKYDILTLKSQFTTINTTYTATSNAFDSHLIKYESTSNLLDTTITKYLATSNLTDNLRTAYSNDLLEDLATFKGYYNGNLMINSKSDGITITKNLTVDSNVIFGSNLIINHNNIEPSLSLKNGEGYLAWTRPQIKFSYNGVDEYNHYIHTSHSSTTSRARMDFLICSGAINNNLTTNTANVMSLVGNSRVGIGTTAPGYNLDVVGTGNFSGNITVGGTASITGNISSANFSGTTVFSDPTSTYGSLNITGTARGLYLGYVIDNSSGFVDTSSFVGIFDFTNTQWAFYMRRSTGAFVVPTGNVGIGNTNPSYKLHVSTDSCAKPSTNTWTIASDIRLKTNIEVADYDRCYNIMSLLDLKKYRWRDDIEELGPENIRDRSKLGWIADDVKKFYPKAVNVIPEAYGLSNVLDLNSDSIYACMYGCIKKLMFKIEHLEKRINYLELQK